MGEPGSPHVPPTELRGRASAAGEALASLPYVTAIGLGSALVTIVDYRLLTVTAAGGLATAATYLLRGQTFQMSS